MYVVLVNLEIWKRGKLNGNKEPCLCVRGLQG